MDEKPIIPEVPFVYREDGYLVLTLSIRKGEVHYFSTRDGGKSHNLSFPVFMARMRIPEPVCNPYRLALNILAQVRKGTLRVRVKDERKILNMLIISQEELEKLDLPQLGREYARLVGKEAPADKPKAKLVKELLMTLEQQVKEGEAKDGDNAQQPAPAGDSAPATAPTTAPAAEGTPPAADTKEKAKVSKKKAAPKKPEKKAAAPAKNGSKGAPALKKTTDKKPEKKATPAAKKGDGPFREGSKKSKAYAFFKSSGGDRDKVIKHTVGLGCTDATARSWYSVFCKVGKA